MTGVGSGFYDDYPRRGRSRPHEKPRIRADGTRVTSWGSEFPDIEIPIVTDFGSGAEHEISGPVMIRNVDGGVLGIADVTGRLYRVSGFDPSDLSDVGMHPTKVSLIVRPKRRVVGGVTAELVSGRVLGKGGITFEKQTNDYRITYPITDNRCKSCWDSNWGGYCDQAVRSIQWLRDGQARRYGVRPEDLDDEFPRTYNCLYNVILLRKLTPLTS